MIDVAIARVLHGLAVVFWIGGVALVTTVLLPATRRLKAPHERMEFFDAIERRFAAQARIATLVTGISGLYLVWRFGLWARFAHPQFWWMHAMVLVWAVFTVVLFLLEPLFLRRRLTAYAQRDPESAFALVVCLHWLLLALSLVAVAGALGGSHGLL
jgi:uncharacterized membrane protein